MNQKQLSILKTNLIQSNEFEHMRAPKGIGKIKGKKLDCIFIRYKKTDRYLAILLLNKRGKDGNAGWYNSAQSIIVINKKSFIKQEAFFALIHEIGHFLSHQKKGNTDHFKVYDKFFVDGKKLSKKEKLIILNEETRAWVLGYNLVKKFYDIDKTYFDLKKECLDEYRKLLSI